MMGKRRKQDEVWEARVEAMLGRPIARHYVIPKAVYKLLIENAPPEALETAVTEYFMPNRRSVDAAADARDASKVVDDLRRMLRNAVVHRTALSRAIEPEAPAPWCYDVPRLGEFLLLCVLSKKARESLPGDLAEEFITKIVPKVGLRRARLWYWCQVVKSMGPLMRLGLVSSLFAWVLRQLGR